MAEGLGRVEKVVGYPPLSVEIPGEPSTGASTPSKACAGALEQGGLMPECCGIVG
jgi:hypothetical protein